MSSPGATLEASRPPLTRQRILRAGIEVAGERGVSNLTMRGLAASLGYEVMSLYNHVASKADLLDGMLDLVVADIALPGSAGDSEDWQLALRRSCLSAHDALSAHPWVSPLWATSSVGPARITLLESWLRTLHHSPLTDQVAHRGFHALSNHVVGFALQQAELTQATQPAPAREEFLAKANDFLATLDQNAYPRMAEHVRRHLRDSEVDRSFTFVLDLILDGLADQRRTSASPAGPGQQEPG
ncbi:MAG: TetR/AcrR family transcriptional regulator C-terminal domain-containing protein [Ornithinimicrobium sp.]